MPSLHELQEQIKDFCNQSRLESPPEYRLLDTVSELGEVAKEMLKMSDYGRKPLQYHPKLQLELGDVLFSLITLANSFDIDLDEAVQLALAKYRQRLAKGGAGSEHDAGMASQQSE